VKYHQLSGLLLVILLLPACASWRVQREIAAGRAYLRAEQPDRALPHFEMAAKANPEYVTNFTEFPVGVWTYIGRSYYELGDLGKARAALDRSIRTHRNAILGHTYLGAVQIGQGQIPLGLQTASTGLENLHSWFAQLDATNPYSSYWDPSNQVRNTTTTLIKDIRTREKDWVQIASTLDWIGWQMDQEIDLSRRDITFDLTDGDSDTTPGP
jgi:tetratricopeptide (TPR) repeat protein